MQGSVPRVPGARWGPQGWAPQLCSSGVPKGPEASLTFALPDRPVTTRPSPDQRVSVLRDSDLTRSPNHSACRHRGGCKCPTGTGSLWAFTAGCGCPGVRGGTRVTCLRPSARPRPETGLTSSVALLLSFVVYWSELSDAEGPPRAAFDSVYVRRVRTRRSPSRTMSPSGLPVVDPGFRAVRRWPRPRAVPRVVSLCSQGLADQGLADQTDVNVCPRR